MKKLFSLLFLVLFTHWGHAQKKDSVQSLTELFQLYEQKDMFFVNALVRKEGKTTHEHSAGFQNVEKGIKNSKYTRFLIGSITKTYTATLAMQLVEEGKLKLGTTLDTYFPTLPNASIITVEMLLKHRSGLFNYTNDPAFYQKVIHPITSDKLVQSFDTLKINFPAGTKHEYSNTNYILLGKIIEKVTNDTYESQLQKRILQPLGLKNTYLRTDKLDTNVATSYYNDGKWHATQPEWNVGWAWSAGEIAATAEDVALFYEALFEGKLVKSTTLQQMMYMEEGYGLGMVIVPYYEKQFYGHSGKIENFMSLAAYNPQDKTVFVRLVNGISKYGDNDISIQVLNATYNRPIESPIKDIDSSILAAYAGEYTAEGFPLGIKVFTENGQLYAQATGQGAFPLNAKSATKFEFAPSFIQMEFVKQEGKQCFHFHQGPNKLFFVKK